MANPNNHWASPDGKGGWKHQREGSERASRVYDTQAEAAEAARKAAQRDGGEMFIQRPDGRIRERNTYGHDPYPPKG